MLLISDLPKIPVCAINALAPEGYAAVLTSNRNDEAQLIALSADMKERLVVQEAWKEILPKSSLLISSAISGGDLRQRFREAAAKRSCFLLIDPIKTTFPLPCPDGVGTPVSEIPPTPHFYSDALCCYYAHSKSSFTLWDTEETLLKKMQLAKDFGFLGFAVQE